MAADFHGVIEIDDFSELFLRPNGFAYVDWPRHHDLFALLRTHDDQTGVPRRGFPNPCSFLAQLNYGVEVVPDTLIERGEWETMPEFEANECLDRGESHRIASSCAARGWISHPGNQFANWITLTELNSACKLVESSVRSLSPECKATIAAMQSLEIDGCHCRLVYWFDV